MIDITPESGPQPDAGTLLFRLRDVKKAYTTPRGRIEVLKSIDLDVRVGEFLLVEGRSGIGKSTLLHLMGLLDRADTGEILLEGRDLSRMSSRERATLRSGRVSFVFQLFHLLPEFTALENVLMSVLVSRNVLTWMRTRTDVVDRARRLIEAVGLGNRADHRPSELSGGERQRVAIARALLPQPAVVLCDEPTGNLDVRTADEIHELLARLNRETGCAFVVVSHEAGFRAIASRVVRIVDGRISEGSDDGRSVESRPT